VSSKSWSTFAEACLASRSSQRCAPLLVVATLAPLPTMTACGAVTGVRQSPAQKLQNIRRALHVLRKQKVEPVRALPVALLSVASHCRCGACGAYVQTMPMEHLWSEAEIRDGDSSVVIPLLLQIRKAYGHHLVKAAATTAK
jgi:hypothetical protein